MHYRLFRKRGSPFSIENAPQILGFGGRPPPSCWVSSPTFLVVFPSSCSRSIFLSPQLSLHPLPEPFSLTRDLLSQPRAAAKLSLPSMRPPPEPPPQNNQTVVTIFSLISNPKTMFQALPLMVGCSPTFMVGTHPPSTGTSTHFLHYSEVYCATRSRSLLPTTKASMVDLLFDLFRVVQFML